MLWKLILSKLPWNNILPYRFTFKVLGHIQVMGLGSVAPGHVQVMVGGFCGVRVNIGLTLTDTNFVYNKIKRSWMGRNCAIQYSIFCLQTMT